MRSGRLFWNCPCRCDSNCSKTSVTEKSGALCTLHHIWKCGPRSSARRLGEEQCHEFVQEASPERRRPEVFMTGTEQTARHGLGQRVLHAGGIESGAFAEKQGGHTLRPRAGVGPE